MTASFDRAVAAVLQHEGGYVDNPKDPGGATNRGVTLAVLADWRGKPVTKDDVRALTEVEARAIYAHRYWMPIRGDDLHPALAFVTLDAAVNSGVKRASIWLQEAIGVTVDGAIGAGTIAAAAKADPAHAVQTCCAARLAFLQSLKTWETFGKGWAGRVREVEAAALRLVSASAL